MDRAFSIEDALVYLDKIKCAYGHRPEVYSKFLAIMKEFKTQIIKTDQVIQKVSALFADNEHLAVEFTHFLPCEVDTAPNATSTEVEQHAPTKMQQAHAMQYVIKVRNRFIHYPLVYSRFLDILQVYHSSRQTIAEVLEHVAQLFEDQKDLLTEFVYFLPEALQDQAKTRMDLALQDYESRRRQREKEDMDKNPLLASANPPHLLASPSLSELAPQGLPMPSSPMQSAVQTVPLIESNPLPRTTKALSNSSDPLLHSSSSSLSTSSGISSAGFEEISSKEAYMKVTKMESGSSQPPQMTSETEAAQPPPRAIRSAATCFHTPATSVVSSDRPIVGSKRKKNSTEEVPEKSYNTRRSSKPEAAVVSPTSTTTRASSKLPPQPDVSSLTLEQLWTRNVQMSAAMNDLDRRLSTVECLVDLQRKRMEDQKAEIVALKSNLNNKQKGKN